MAPKTILTPFQQKLLTIIAENNYIASRFYLTGGTALAEFYLKHRLSEDFDLFSEKEVYLPAVVSFLKKIAEEIGLVKLEHRPFLGLHSFMLHLRNHKKFKIDFNFYPHPRIELGKKYRQLQIDSLHDIAANKVHTLFMKPRARDYVDLFLILKNSDFTLKQLIIDAKTKFDWHIDPLLLGSQLKKVQALQDLPKMLVPFDKSKMEKFFISLAKSLEPDIFKN